MNARCRSHLRWLDCSSSLGLAPGGMPGQAESAATRASTGRQPPRRSSCSTSPTIQPASSTRRSTRSSPRLEGDAQPGREHLAVARRLGKQARAVIDGLEADVVTLALAYDIDSIADKGKLLPPTGRSACPTTARPTSRRSCSWSARETRRGSRTGTTW